ncbi:MAG: DCC1-like thiol-disulfide oxidoreductase family protein [Acidimicrobiia bacterium]
MEEHRSVLVYDGDCGFCTTSANWIARRWPAGDGRVAIPWQMLSSDFARDIGLSEADFQRAAWWIERGEVEEGWRAIARAVVAARGLWSIVGGILLMPPFSWIAPFGYRVVARYRYRLPGGTPACKINP